MNKSYKSVRDVGGTHDAAMVAELRNLAAVLAGPGVLAQEVLRVGRRLVELADRVKSQKREEKVSDACRLLRSTKRGGKKMQPAVVSALSLLEP